MIVKTFLMDKEFDKTIDDLMENVVVNNSTSKVHVAESNKNIYTGKERSQCIITTMTLKYLHKLLITNIVYFSFLLMNAFPIRWGIPDKFLLRAIVVRTNLDKKKLQVDSLDIL